MDRRFASDGDIEGHRYIECTVCGEVIVEDTIAKTGVAYAGSDATIKNDLFTVGVVLTVVDYVVGTCTPTSVGA